MGNWDWFVIVGRENCAFVIPNDSGLRLFLRASGLPFPSKPYVDCGLPESRISRVLLLGELVFGVAKNIVTCFFAITFFCTTYFPNIAIVFSMLKKCFDIFFGISPHD